MLYMLFSYITVGSGRADNKDTMNEDPEFPKSINELYKCCTKAFRYGSELTSDHPVTYMMQTVNFACFETRSLITSCIMFIDG